MKILVLSANTGEGHNSSGKALINAMKAQGIEAELKDTLSISKPNGTSDNSQAVSNAYVRSTRGFNIFSKIYAFAMWVSRHLNGHRHSPIYFVNKLYWRRLWHFIDDGGYDAVISVHLFSAEKLTALKREGKLKIPSVFVMTDYTIHPFLNDTELDYYVLPHKDLFPLWISDGFNREQLLDYGIPVDEEQFTNRMDKDEARKRVAELLGFEFQEKDSTKNNSRWYLVMSGSMGFGNMSVLLKEFREHIRPNSRVICVCGRNENNMNIVRREFADDSRICPVGYTDKIALMMDACDVVMTKPGGISTTESMIKNIPLVHTTPIPGIEDENAKFCHAHKMSFYSEDLKEQAAMAIRLANDAEYRDEMLKGQRANTHPDACERIIELMKRLVSENEKIRTDKNTKRQTDGKL